MRSRNKELALSNLLESNEVDVAIITETELTADQDAVFILQGYMTFVPPPLHQKVTVLALVKSTLAVQRSAKAIQ